MSEICCADCASVYDGGKWLACPECGSALVCAPPPSPSAAPATPMNAAEIRLAEKRPIDAIKAYRNRTGCTLKQAKDAFDAAPSPSPGAPHAHNCASIEQGRTACNCAPSPGATTPLTDPWEALTQIREIAAAALPLLTLNDVAGTATLLAIRDGAASVLSLRRLRADEEGREALRAEHDRHARNASAFHDAALAYHGALDRIRKAMIVVQCGQHQTASPTNGCRLCAALQEVHGALQATARAPSPSLPDAPLCGEWRINSERLAYGCRLPPGHDGDHHPNPCGHDGCTGLECLRAPLPDGRDATREANPNSSTEEN
jgi:hypothetical protein